MGNTSGGHPGGRLRFAPGSPCSRSPRRRARRAVARTRWPARPRTPTASSTWSWHRTRSGSGSTTTASSRRWRRRPASRSSPRRPGTSSASSPAATPTSSPRPRTRCPTSPTPSRSRPPSSGKYNADRSLLGVAPGSPVPGPLRPRGQEDRDLHRGQHHAGVGHVRQGDVRPRPEGRRRRLRAGRHRHPEPRRPGRARRRRRLPVPARLRPAAAGRGHRRAAVRGQVGRAAVGGELRQQPRGPHAPADQRLRGP